MIICENKLGVSEFLSSQHRIICTYNGKINNDLALEHLEKILEFYRTGSPVVDVAIVDLRAVYGSYMKLMGYFTNTFYPAISKTSLKAQAVIVKDDVIVNHLARKLIYITELFSLKSRIFFNEEDAEVWLSEFFKK
ncbi:MAG: hypothetical protein KDC79_08950 [Cyclobacteriaceae bacterium]|nr:hypothetical protein [Cyclobacteriaceae bacterium]